LQMKDQNKTGTWGFGKPERWLINLYLSVINHLWWMTDYILNIPNATPNIKMPPYSK
jgi:hypothetical protein